MAKRNLYIHIGPHKTGTSTIQRGLVLNRDALNKIGYDYPDVAFAYNGQHGLVADLLNEKDNPSGGLDELVSFARASKNHIIISSERFDEINDKAPLERLRDALKGQFDFHIITYLRPQEEILQSLWQTSVLFDNIRDDFEDWLPKALDERAFLQFDRWLHLFEDVFGHQSLNVKTYNPASEDLLPSFLSLCGVTDLPSFQSQPRANISLPALTFEIARRLYIYPFLERMQKEGKSVRAMQLPLEKAAAAIHEFAHQEKIDLRQSLYQREMLNAIRSRFQPHNQTTARRYLNRPRLFESRKAMVTPRGRLIDQLSPEQALRLSGTLIEFEQKRRNTLNIAR